MEPIKTKKHLPLILLSFLFVLGIILWRIFVFKEIPQPAKEGVFQVPLQQDVGREKLRVSKAQNETLAQFTRFPNFEDLREILLDNEILWIATGNGLVKYDPERREIIKIYTEADGLPDNIVTTLGKYKDKIFLGTQGGLSIFDPEEEGFVNYFNQEEWRYNANLFDFVLRDDNLWMSTFGGLRRYDLVANQWFNFSPVDVSLAATSAALYFIEPRIGDNNQVFKVALRAESETQISSSLEDKGCNFEDIEANETEVLVLCHLSPGKGSKIYHLAGEEGSWEEISALTLPSEKQAYYAFDSMTVMGNEVFLKEIQSDGLVRIVYYNLETKNKDYLNLPSEVASEITTSFSREGNLIWFGTTSADLYSYGFSTAKLNSFLESQKFPTIIRGILAQKEDVVLANTNLGLGLVDFQKKKWEGISEKVKDQASGIWQGDDLWVVSYDAEMTISNIELIHYNLVNKSKEVWGLEDDSNLAGQIIAQENGKLWFTAGEILLYDPKTKKEEPFPILPSKDNRYFLFDKPKIADSNIWFGFADISEQEEEQGGLVKFDFQEKKYSFPDLPENFAFAPRGGVMVAGKEVYFSPSEYQEKGLYIYNRDTQEVRTINKDNSELKQNGANLLAYQDGILAMKVKGEISKSEVGRSLDSFWDKYYEVGLELYDIISNKWSFFRTEQGLIDNEITAALIGDDYIYILGGGVTRMEIKNYSNYTN